MPRSSAHAPFVFVLAALLGAGTASAEPPSTGSIPARRVEGDQRRPPALDAVERPGASPSKWLRLKPYLHQGAWGTTNLLEAPNARRSRISVAGRDVGGRTSDTVFSTSPGLDLVFGATDVAELSLGYAATLLQHARRPGLNTVEHRARYAGHLDLSDLGVGELRLSSAGSAAWGISHPDPIFMGRVRSFRAHTQVGVEDWFSDAVGVVSEGWFQRWRAFPGPLEFADTAQWGQELYLAISPTDHDALALLLGGGWREWHLTHHRATDPDLSFAHAGGGLRLRVGKLLELDARAHYAFAQVKKRRGLSRDVNLPDSLYARSSATLHFGEGADLRLGARAQLEPSPGEAYRQTTALDARLDVTFDHLVLVTVAATYTHQDPRRAANLYRQDYLLGLTYYALDVLELGAQASYTRTTARARSFEVFELGLSLTLKL